MIIHKILYLFNHFLSRLFSKRRLALALVFSLIINLTLPPIQTLSQIGILTIAPNKFITPSEIPEYLYQHLNKGFSAYFGSSTDKTKPLASFTAHGRSIEWELLPKELPVQEATESATPTVSPTTIPVASPSATLLPEALITPPIASPSPDTKASPSGIPSPTIDPALKAALTANSNPPQSTLAAQLDIHAREIQESLASISGQIREIASEAARIGKEIRFVSNMQVIRGRLNDSDLISFKKADADVNIDYNPTDDGLRQTITVSSKDYKWPLVLLLNPNGLLLNRSNTGKFFLSDPITQAPLINLGAFIVKSESTGLTEKAEVEYTIQNDKLAILVKPSFKFLTDDQVKGDITIENTITPTSQQAETSETQSPDNQQRAVYSGKSIKTTFEDAPDNYKYQLDQGVYKVKLFDDSNKYSFSFESNGKSVTQSLINDTTKDVSKITATEKDSGKDIDKIEAKDVVDGKIDLRYEPIANGIKESIVLNDKSAASFYPINSVVINEASISASLIPLTFSLNLNGLRIEEGSDSRFYFVDITSNMRLFHIEKPYALDAKNVQTNDVYYQIDKNNNLSILIDKSWLTASERVFPVTIDPTYTVASGAKIDTAASYSFQRKSWFDGTRYWIAFSNGTAIVFYYSANNGATWTQNGSNTVTATPYSESVVTVNHNTSVATYSTCTGSLECERVQAGASGKIASVDLAMYMSTTSFQWAAVFADGASTCTTPGAQLTSGVAINRYGGGAYTFEFGNEGTPVYKNDYFCICVICGGSRWYGSSTTNHYKVIKYREQEADFSVYGDESNAYIVYKATNSTLIRARKNGANYPGTAWAWGSAVDIFDGGQGGTDGEGRFDMPNIASASGKIHITARRSLYQGTATMTYDYRDGTTMVLPTGYTAAVYAPFEPSFDGNVDSIDLRVNSTGASRTIYAKVCDGVSNCGTSMATGQATAVVGITRISFSTEPYVSAEKQYSIYVYASAADVNVNMQCTNNGSQACNYAKLINPQGSNLYGEGVKVKPRSVIAVMGKRTNLDLTNIVATFTTTNLGDVANTAMGNIAIPGMGPNEGKILFLYNDGAALKFITYNGSTYSSAATVTNSANTANDLTKNLSGTADNTGVFHIAYVNAAGNLVYQTLASDFSTWSAQDKIDYSAANLYPSLMLGQGNDVLFATWYRSDLNTVRFARFPANIPDWSAAQTLYTAAATDQYLGTMTISSEQLLVFRQSGTEPSFSILTDMINTGLSKQMRHGRTFENEGKQPAAY